MDDLVEWLRAQLDDDEAYARNAVGDHNEAVPEWTEIWSGAVQVGPHEDVVLTNDSQVSRHMVRHDPAHELNIVTAHRAILAEHVPWHFDGNTNPPDRILCLICSGPNRHGEQCGRTYPCSTLRSLALAYADRPGYQEAWRPAREPSRG